MGSFWNRFGIVLGLFWENVGTVWESLWDNFEINLGSVWDNFGIRFGHFYSEGEGVPPFHHSYRHKAGPTYNEDDKKQNPKGQGRQKRTPKEPTRRATRPQVMALTPTHSKLPQSPVLGVPSKCQGQPYT